MTNIITPTFWRSLITLEDVKHKDKHGNVIWECDRIPNIMHLEGETFILELAFETNKGNVVPADYYIGLDNRTTINVDDTLASLTGEPNSGVNAYERQTVNSFVGFTVLTDDNDNVKATSSIVTFEAVGGSWGPVSNAFLATTSDNAGLLFATSALTSTITLVNGENFSFRMSISLAQC